MEVFAHVLCRRVAGLWTVTSGHHTAAVIRLGQRVQGTGAAPHRTDCIQQRVPGHPDTVSEPALDDVQPHYR